MILFPALAEEHRVALGQRRELKFWVRDGERKRPGQVRNLKGVEVWDREAGDVPGGRLNSDCFSRAMASSTFCG